MPGKNAASEPEQPVAGFFGKLPGRGDFIGRHLPKSFLAPWDAWLQTAIAKSRIQLGEHWQDCYCTSPIWRFALSPGVCGAAAYAGILMPSMDRVGRYYPLAIAVPLSPSALPLLSLLEDRHGWFSQAEQIALAGLDSDATLDLDHFSQQVEALGAPSNLSTPVADDVAVNAWYCPLEGVREFAQTWPAFANHLLQRSFPQHSLWWSEGSERITRCLLVCAGLPPVDSFAALLAGNWKQWGWDEKRLTDSACHSGEPPAAGEELP